jgi:CubicO group peptidase (beta-lactamase class C family)
MRAIHAAVLAVVLALAVAAGAAQTAQAPLSADTPGKTVAGATFIAPAGWSVTVKGPATIVEAPEGDSRIALVDVTAADADAAVATAWAAYRPDAKWPLRSKSPSADRDGWQDQWTYVYQISPDLRRDVVAGTLRHAGQWTVWIYDMSQPTGEKRLAQVELVFGRLLPAGYQRETFTGRTAHALDEARVKELGAFVERAQKALGVPGVSIGLVQGGKVVLASGFGVRRLGQPTPVDGDSLYIIASNTKAMTTLLLAKLVGEGKLTWDTPVTSVLPQFRLGDADTTRRVLVKHLVCACTGLPRQDFEWLLEFKNATPASALAVLGTMQPTSGFGEMFQYSNPLAAAGGYVGGHVLFPAKELGEAYDVATLDFARALGGNHATSHGLSIDASPDLAAMDVNYSIVPVRPAGGAWSSVKDMLKYVSMELAGGRLPDGTRYIPEAALLARRAPQVSIGKDATYGMGLEVDTTYGTPVVHHGGSMIGYKSDMMWLPEHNVGAVILTNSDAGGAMLGPFRRKLLEVLFDGKAEADADIATRGKAMRERILAERKLLTVPAAADDAAALASKYANPALGEIQVSRSANTTTFDFGEWRSPMASRKNPDGTVSLVTIATGIDGLEFVVRKAATGRTLVFRDAQHEYVFTER